MEYRVTRVPESDDYLEHHGVKGQKWGVRRYKNLRSRAVETYTKGQQAKEDLPDSEGEYYRLNKKSQRLAYKKTKAESKGRTRKAVRLGRRLEKTNVKVERSGKDVDELRATIKRSQREYNDLINKASKEPVYLKDTTASKATSAALVSSLYDAVYVTAMGDSAPKNMKPTEMNFETEADRFDNKVMEKKYGRAKR